ncbi:hypothetical protein [Polaromonas sp.]|uniref:hypothetical protein n=1 Tax=Polaromonas sp. TaxID=1869339 RepID=UPI002487D8B0|nr:hypothetical protein [Polaromonas sp.]MDI1274925.1 hypothetical protein [Polaromonas sp.]
MGDFSLFEYCYRDASNYKSWGTLLLQGHASNLDIEDLQRHFDSGCYFIAEQLRIPPLYAELWAFSGGPSIDDHVWHTFHTLRPATAQDMAAPLFDSFENLLQKVKAVQAWDETLSPHWGI